jgi:TolB-like protein/class 3 adenylate cyclase/Tfp pilus assembly protein PilF
MKSEPGRRLAAVWFADIVGFTALSSRDEDAALLLVNTFQAITRKVVAEAGGTVVKFLGDGGLAVFPSADGAVRAGLAVQREFQTRSAAAGNAASLRVGVHLGEVVSAPDGDVYGDGVNTAARIQHEAEPGQVVVSEDIWRQIRQRSGYQFDALGERALKGLDERVRLYAVGGTPEEIDAARPVSPRLPGKVVRARTIAIAVAGALTLGVAGWWLSTHRGGASPTAGPAVAQAATSIAVLPFADLSPTRDQEYFGDGMTEELINALTRVEGLEVVSRTSAFAYKGQSLDVREIGRRLGVGTVLEGSVRVAGDQLRVTAQLIDVDSGFHLWSDSYDRDMKDVFAIQEEIARSIVTAVEPELAPAGGTLVLQGTNSPEAYRLYLQGRYFWNNRKREGLMRAIELFEAAIRTDPKYARAYTGLADSYWLLNIRGFMSSAETTEKWRAAARKALALDPGLSEAHTSYGRLLFFRDWDLEAAGRELEQAVALDPRNADARHEYSHYLMATGRIRESLEQSQRAVEISPYEIILNTHIGWHYLFARDYDRAVEALTRTEEMDPGNVGNHAILAVAYQLQGKNAEALAHCEMAVAISRDDAFAMGFVGFAYARAGREQDALELVRDLEQRGDQTYYYVALIHAGLRDRDRAFAWLERAIAERSPNTVEMNADPRLDELRADPRFATLVAKIGLR